MQYRSTSGCQRPVLPPSARANAEKTNTVISVPQSAVATGKNAFDYARCWLRPEFVPGNIAFRLPIGPVIQSVCAWQGKENQYPQSRPNRIDQQRCRRKTVGERTVQFGEEEIKSWKLENHRLLCQRRALMETNECELLCFHVCFCFLRDR